MFFGYAKFTTLYYKFYDKFASLYMMPFGSLLQIFNRDCHTNFVRLICEQFVIYLNLTKERPIKKKLTPN